MRKLLQRDIRSRETLVLTLVHLNEWLTTVSTKGLDTALAAMGGVSTSSGASELIQDIAEGLTGHAAGLDHQLQSKSMQEALFYCVGADPYSRYSQVKARLSRHLDQRSPSALVQRFLVLCFFNLVWFEIGESFGPSARNPDSFEQDLESVELVCRRVVSSSWRALNMMRRPLNLSTAEELIANIDHRLRGV